MQQAAPPTGPPPTGPAPAPSPTDPAPTWLQQMLPTDSPQPPAGSPPQGAPATPQPGIPKGAPSPDINARPMTWASPAPNEQPSRRSTSGRDLAGMSNVAGTGGGNGPATPGGPPPGSPPQGAATPLAMPPPAGAPPTGPPPDSTGGGTLAGIVAGGMEAAGFGEFAVTILAKQHPDLDRLYIKAMAAQRGYSIEATDQFLTDYKNRNSGLAQGGVVKQGEGGAWATVEGQFQGGGEGV